MHPPGHTARTWPYGSERFPTRENQSFLPSFAHEILGKIHVLPIPSL